MTSEEQGVSAQEKVAAAARGITQFETTTFRTLGIGAWLALGIAGVLALGLYLVALVADVAIPLAIAVVLAAILVPLADRLERWHVSRWLGATLVLILALSLVVGTLALIVGAITSQSDEIWTKLEPRCSSSTTAAPSWREPPGGSCPWRTNWSGCSPRASFGRSSAPRAASSSGPCSPSSCCCSC